MNTASNNDSTLLVFREIPFSTSAEDVLRAMKIRKISPSLARLAEELVEGALRVTRPKGLCRVSYIDERTDDSVTIDGQVFTSHVLRQNLEGIERVFPFVATCGTEIEGLLEDRADIMAAYCLDTIMMIAVQRARRHIEQFIKDSYSVGQLSRMAPGSLPDWPLQEQRPLFQLLGDVDGAIGVKLSERFLMTPIKSISGIFFPTEVRFESCQLCSRPNCPGRRAPHDAELAAKYGV
jgi:hypothetical protein